MYYVAVTLFAIFFLIALRSVSGLILGEDPSVVDATIVFLASVGLFVFSFEPSISPSATLIIRDSERYVYSSHSQFSNTSVISKPKAKSRNNFGRPGKTGFFY